MRRWLILFYAWLRARLAWRKATPASYEAPRRHGKTEAAVDFLDTNRPAEQYFVRASDRTYLVLAHGQWLRVGSAAYNALSGH